MKTVMIMYLTLLSPILAGIFNMIWCKAPILQKLQIPIDGGKNFADGKRLFGDNKTWKGLIGYLILNILVSVIWGILCNRLNINQYNFFYMEHENVLLYNLWIGLLLGLGYSLFELPNSFLKRRLNIEPGKPTEGIQKYFFIFLDQADSVFGCCLVVCFFHSMSIGFYFLYVLLGAGTHIVINMMLYFLKLRKNMF